MKAGDIYTDRKAEREKEIKQLATSGITKKNIAALEKKSGGKKRRSKKTLKKKLRRRH